MTPYQGGDRVRSLMDSPHKRVPLAVGDVGEVIEQVSDVLVAVNWQGAKFEDVVGYSYMLTHQIEHLGGAPTPYAASQMPPDLLPEQVAQNGSQAL